MKKTIMVLLIALILSLFSQVFSGLNHPVYSFNDKINITVSDPDIDRIEYVLSDGQWYEIIYYTDGSIIVVPVQCPPEDKKP